MPKWKEGDKVKVVTRDVTEEDRKANRYFSHMAGLTGVVEYLYDGEMVSIRVEPESLPKITSDVHKMAATRMREKFLGQMSDEQKKTLAAEELNFNVNFTLLVQAGDLEKA